MMKRRFDYGTWLRSETSRGVNIGWRNTFFLFEEREGRFASDEQKPIRIEVVVLFWRKLCAEMGNGLGVKRCCAWARLWVGVKHLWCIVERVW